MTLFDDLVSLISGVTDLARIYRFLCLNIFEDRTGLAALMAPVLLAGLKHRVYRLEKRFIEHPYHDENDRDVYEHRPVREKLDSG